MWDPRVVCQFIHIPSAPLAAAWMEKDNEPPLATERYGSAGSWRYTVKDGVVERRREGREGASRRNSIVGVFKVSQIHCMSTWQYWVFSPSLTFTSLGFRVCFCLKDTQRVSVMTTCSTSSGIQCRYLRRTTEIIIFIIFIKTLHPLSPLPPSGFLQLSVWDPGHSGVPPRGRCWRPWGHSGCSNRHLVIERWDL